MKSGAGGKSNDATEDVDADGAEKPSRSTRTAGGAGEDAAEVSAPAIAADVGCDTIQGVFDRVAGWVRETPVSSDLDTATTDQKLRMYGLYKRATCGAWDAASSPPPPSAFRLEAHAKHRAWKKCSEISRDEAMLEYVRVAASQENWLGEKCSNLLERFEREQREKGAATITTGGSGKSLEYRTAAIEKSDHVVAGLDRIEDTAAHGATLTTAAAEAAAAAAGFFNFLGVQSLVPRGQLDISYGDLAYAAYQVFFGVGSALRPSRRRSAELESSIADLWLSSSSTAAGSGGGDAEPAPATAEVVVGYSVRTLLDVSFLARQYPEGSEIIVTPPINVPGMLRVLHHHGLKVVPVDLPAAADEDRCGNDSPRDADVQILLKVDVDGVEKAITFRTTAILVVHPFGTLAATEADMEMLRQMATKHDLHLLEDCAECFTGLGGNCYKGSRHAHLSFFSFGLIKTSTALGGGIAVVRDSADLASRMDQLQRSSPMFRPQSPWSLLRRIVACFLFRFIANSPIVYGLIASICCQLRFDLDSVVTSAVRGFSPGGGGMRHIRQTPCPALLALLYRRLLDSAASQCRSVSSRIRQCQHLTKILENDAPAMLFHYQTSDNEDDSPPWPRSTYWLYPILSDKPAEVCAGLRLGGFDSTRGSSQLRCVGHSNECPRASKFMERILYLPVASQMLSEFDIRRIASTLVEAEQVGRCEKRPQEARPKRIQRINWLPIVLFSSLCSIIVFLSSLSLVRLVSCFLIPSMIALSLLVLLVSFVLRWSIADFYTNTSTCFARYSPMLSSPPFSTGENKGGAASVPSDHDVISSMSALRIQNGETSDESRKIILTGATGFIGSLLLRDLLLHRKSLSIAQVFVVCRPKRGCSAEDRIARLLHSQQFAFLSVEEKRALVKAIEGDVTKLDAGLGEQDLRLIRHDSTISHIFHCAASVSFTQTLPDAARSNISSALHLQKLAASLPAKNAQFVHVSTAFVHGSSLGTKSRALPEQLHNLGDYEPLKLYRSMLDTQFYASKAMVELGFHNSYTFSKCVCEHLLSLNSVNVRTSIFRPTIVGPSIENPHEGWAGERPSTLVAAACLYLAYQWNLWSFGNQRVPCIPVDVVTRFMLSKVFVGQSDSLTTNASGDEASSSDGSFEKISRCDLSSEGSSEATGGCRIFNVAWDAKSPPATGFTWLEYAVSVTQMGAVIGYFSRPTAYVGLLITARILPILSLSTEQFGRLHNILVHLPLQVVQKLYRLLRKDLTWINKLASFLDLPLLFFPFMNNAFYFQSDLVAPPSFDGSRYMFSCTAASNAFMRRVKAQEPVGAKTHTEKGCPGMEILCVGGACHRMDIHDAWWALTQPRGNFFIRLAGWLLIKVFRATCGEVTVDTRSFAAVASLIESTGGGFRIVLAPTHRSFFDSLVLSFILFSVPELQLDIPFVAAADDFEKLNIIGFLARQSGAFFLRRGQKREDPRLRESLRAISNNQRKRSTRGQAIEVFIEGSRSRDRRFLEPKTGFLRCLREEEESLLIVPVTVNYEKVPEQETLSSEACNEKSTSLSLGGLISWLFMAAKGKICLGRVHVAAGNPTMTKTNDRDVLALANTIQQRQQDQLYISDYHVDALSRLLPSLDSDTARKGMSKLGCKWWPASSIHRSPVPQPPVDRSELATICLQASPYLARMLRDTRPEWASWLCRQSGESVAVAGLVEDPSVAVLSIAFSQLLDEADSRTERALRLLEINGFRQPKPGHVLQAALDLESTTTTIAVPTLFQYASVLISPHEDIASTTTYDGARAIDGCLGDTMLNHSMPRRVLDDSEEALGFWGFHDSSFLVKMDTHGTPYVTMQGDRYPLCDKRVLNLLPFIEEATQVRINLLNEAFQNAQATSCDDFIPPSRMSGCHIERLQSSVGGVSESVNDRIRHGTGHSQEDVFSVRSRQPPRVPDVVVWPESEAGVAELVRLAKAHLWCLIPFGGGTNVSQSTRCPSLDVEPRPIVSVDMKKMNRIIWIDEENGLAHVEAGITGRELVDGLAVRGYTMGHEPDSIEFSTLGGWIATKASGMKRARYGNIEDIVKGVRAVGADGGILHHGGGQQRKGNGCGNDQKLVCWGRESSGPDLRDMLLGSEGCLGIITSAVMRVWPVPDVSDHDGILLPDFETGTAFVRDVSRLGSVGRMPASVRLLDNEHFRLGQALAPEPVSAWESGFKTMMKFLAKMKAARNDVDWNRAVLVTVTYEGDREDVTAQKSALARISGRYGGISLGPRAGRSGYDMTFVIAYLRDFAMTYHCLGESFETFVPWTEVNAVVTNTKRRVRQEHASRHLPGRPFVGCRITQLYHEGACLYFYLCMNFDGVANPSRSFADIEHAARDEILLSGGALTHHHGIGKIRRQFLPKVRSPAFRAAVRAAKAGMDPDNVFGARNGAFADDDDVSDFIGGGDASAGDGDQKEEGGNPAATDKRRKVVDSTSS